MTVDSKLLNALWVLLTLSAVLGLVIFVVKNQDTDDTKEHESVANSRQRRSILIKDDELHNFLCWKYGHGSPSSNASKLYSPLTKDEKNCKEHYQISRDASKCSSYTVCATSNDDNYLHNYHCQCDHPQVFSLERKICTNDDSDCPTTPSQKPYFKIDDLYVPRDLAHQSNGKKSPELNHKCQFTGKFPLEKHCDKYLQCLPGPNESLEAYLHECPPGKHYSKNYRLCMHPHLARCPYTGDDDTSTPSYGTPSTSTSGSSTSHAVIYKTSTRPPVTTVPPVSYPSSGSTVTATTVSYAPTPNPPSHASSSNLPSYATSSNHPSYVTSSKHPSYVSSNHPSYVTSTNRPSYVASSKHPSYVTSANHPSYVTSANHPSYITSAKHPSYVNHVSTPMTITKTTNRPSTAYYASSKSTHGTSLPTKHPTTTKVYTPSSPKPTKNATHIYETTPFGIGTPTNLSTASTSATPYVSSSTMPPTFTKLAPAVAQYSSEGIQKHDMKNKPSLKTISSAHSYSMQNGNVQYSASKIPSDLPYEITPSSTSTPSVTSTQKVSYYPVRKANRTDFNYTDEHPSYTESAVEYKKLHDKLPEVYRKDPPSYHDSKPNYHEHIPVKYNDDLPEYHDSGVSLSHYNKTDLSHLENDKELVYVDNGVHDVDSHQLLHIQPPQHYLDTEPTYKEGQKKLPKAHHQALPTYHDKIPSFLSNSTTYSDTPDDLDGRSFRNKHLEMYTESEFDPLKYDDDLVIGPGTYQEVPSFTEESEEMAEDMYKGMVEEYMKVEEPTYNDNHPGNGNGEDPQEPLLYNDESLAYPQDPKYSYDDSGVRGLYDDNSHRLDKMDFADGTGSKTDFQDGSYFDGHAYGQKSLGYEEFSYENLPEHQPNGD